MTLLALLRCGRVRRARSALGTRLLRLRRLALHLRLLLCLLLLLWLWLTGLLT